MKLHTDIFNKTYKFDVLLNKHYKQILFYIHNRDNKGLCEYIDEITDASYNVYEKFILMLYIYKVCFNDKLVYEKGGKKFIFYLEDLINKLPDINFEKWIEVGDDIQVLVKTPNKFYDKHIGKDHMLTVAEMNEYFINNCIAAIKVGEQIKYLNELDINLLPAHIFNDVIPYIRKIDTEIQKVNLFGELDLKLSLFSIVSIIIFIYNIEISKLQEFEFVMRHYIKMTNFDELTYKHARDIADIYSHDLQAQKDAIDTAKQQAGVQ